MFAAVFADMHYKCQKNSAHFRWTFETM